MKNTIKKIMLVVVNVLVALQIIWFNTIEFGAYVMNVHSVSESNIMEYVRFGAIIGLVEIGMLIVIEVLTFKAIRFVISKKKLNTAII